MRELRKEIAVIFLWYRIVRDFMFKYACGRLWNSNPAELWAKEDFDVYLAFFFVQDISIGIESTMDISETFIIQYVC